MDNISEFNSNSLKSAEVLLGVFFLSHEFQKALASLSLCSEMPGRSLHLRNANSDLKSWEKFNTPSAFIIPTEWKQICILTGGDKAVPIWSWGHMNVQTPPPAKIEGPSSAKLRMTSARLSQHKNKRRAASPWVLSTELPSSATSTALRGTTQMTLPEPGAQISAPRLPAASRSVLRCPG